MSSNPLESFRSPAIPEEVFMRVAAGEALDDICRDRHLPELHEVHRKLIDDESCFLRFMTAQRLRTLADLERLQGIAEGREQVLVREETVVDPVSGDHLVTQHFEREEVQRSKLRVDTIKWRAERLFPTVYGGRLEIAHKASGEFAAILAGAMNKGHQLPSQVMKSLRKG